MSDAPEEPDPTDPEQEDGEDSVEASVEDEAQPKARAVLRLEDLEVREPVDWDNLPATFSDDFLDGLTVGQMNTLEDEQDRLNDAQREALAAWPMKSLRRTIGRMSDSLNSISNFGQTWQRNFGQQIAAAMIPKLDLPKFDLQGIVGVRPSASFRAAQDEAFRAITSEDSSRSVTIKVPPAQATAEMPVEVEITSTGAVGDGSEHDGALKSHEALNILAADVSAQRMLTLVLAFVAILPIATKFQKDGLGPSIWPGIYTVSTIILAMSATWAWNNARWIIGLAVGALGIGFYLGRTFPF